jgi:sialidase-1
MCQQFSISSTFFLAVLLTVPGLSRATEQTADGDRTRQAATVFELGEKKQSKYGFRIPALVVTKSGTLLAFCERRIGLHDHAENDIVLRRSFDHGKNWNPLQIVAEEGGASI